jgi:hypothetical protein
MDWTKQYEEMMQTWTDAQTKMWAAFSESVTGFGKSPSRRMWEQAIARGEELVKNTLAAQNDWLKAWAKNLAEMEGMPEQAGKSLDQFKEMVQRWTGTQEKLWGAWFGFLKKLDPTESVTGWGETAQNPFEFWQETAKQAMDAQTAWMESWMSQLGSSSEE